MPTTPINGLRFPALSDNANVPLFVQNLASDVDSRLVAQLPNSAARDAITPTTGMLVHTANDKRYWRHDGTDWHYAGGAPPPIVLASIVAGWIATAGRVPAVYKDASGLVHVNGGVQPASTYNAQDGGTHTAVQLPVGYRPSINQDFLVLVPSQHLNVTMRIGTDGVMNVIDGPVSVAASANHYLDGISFHPGYTGGALS